MNWVLGLLLYGALGLICEGQSNSSCAHDWRDLELFLPVNINGPPERVFEWKNFFLKTFLTFWPIEISNSKLMIMLDEDERNNSHVNEIRDELSSHQALAQRSRIVFNDAPGVYYDNFGWKRQQYVMMYADNYTNAEFVGFVDTDCMFITYVHGSDIFENGKPVINGKTGNPYKRGQKEEMIWKEITYNTYRTMGVPEPMKCMSYWPVVIRTKHIAEFRQFLEKKFNLPFYEIMRLHISKKWFGQFDMFCSYLYYHHREEYSWYVHNISPEWDFNRGFEGMNSNVSLYSPEMFYPKPRIAIHARYHTPEIFYNSTEYYELLQIGTCMSPPFPKEQHVVKQQCFYYAGETDYTNKVFLDMYKFEKFNFYQGYEWNTLLGAMADRFAKVRGCHHSVGRKRIQEIFGRPLVQEGEVLYTDFTGASLFVFENNTLHRFSGWDSFVSRGLETNPRRKLSPTVFHMLTMGERY